MSWSLSEIEGLARKAARGSGFSWGMAEEAGKAVRWLAGIGLPGPEVLANYLEAYDRTPHAQMRPTDTSQDTWRASGGVICPISAGAALCDLAQNDAPSRDIDIIACAYPLLLLPFVRAAAEDGEQAERLIWQGGEFAFAADVRGAAHTPELALSDARVEHGENAALPLPDCQLRYDLAEGPAERLAAFAARTYAPDTEQSRTSGAGAGLSDND
ncbi:Protein of unknown function [Roseovarius nanhaiticus]|uniref:DUF3726 domain-containing protein n=1 Tax=Roseovarius nanhaiticus TaxID=573024 RepID=A0A1N7FM38_9RHOB|nr:DUF3726 domain-containing protein [Roseovarius nanhaiticus]SEK51182.1 Protein of unknown function [Roseovarius nanhaiticus]SIS01391.1 Protein of unknown function [Roseovarius nanhaiticus]